MKTPQTLYLASPRGFCAGVERAITITNKALEKFGTPIYVNHEIVHNKFVVEQFEAQGVIFTDNIDKIPKQSVYIFSAHGVSPLFREKAEAKKLKIIDATCPLVTKVHWEADKFIKEDYKVFYIGQKNHQEFLGVSDIGNIRLLETIEDIENINSEEYKNKKTVCLTQTTLSIEDTEKILKQLKVKIPHLRLPGDICYATTNRQNAIKELTKKCDFIIVIGSKNSSNSNKLVTTALKSNCPSQLFENAQAIPDKMFQYKNVGLTSGASVPDILIQEVIKKCEQKNNNIKTEIIKTSEENIQFPLPKEIS